MSSEQSRQGKRGHDENGNVRPADGRWELHDPAEESAVSSQTPKRPRRKAEESK